VTQAAEVIGRPAIVQSDSRYSRFVASLDVLIVRSRVPALTIPFLYCLFKTNEFTNHTYAHSTGTTVLHLLKDAIPSFEFALPSKKVLDQFAELAQPIFKRIDTVQRECHILAALRDALLPKLVSGELLVRNVEGEVEAAVE
jgi:type I restriction enzyme S subunit